MTKITRLQWVIWEFCCFPQKTAVIKGHANLWIQILGLTKITRSPIDRLWLIVSFTSIIASVWQSTLRKLSVWNQCVTLLGCLSPKGDFVIETWLKIEIHVSVKVCHSSAFQTILRRSVYIKIINYSDSISANLNNTMQTKQHAMKKTALLFK